MTKKNIQLVNNARRLLASINRSRSELVGPIIFKHVKAHAGEIWNTKADSLAVKAANSNNNGVQSINNDATIKLVEGAKERFSSIMNSAISVENTNVMFS